ncbi:MAG: protein translocase subunit SecF, partial [Acidimicrobiia bacterium]|nr:protein translocase subunit SecF [Acidimicrobiia bacterium]
YLGLTTLADLAVCYLFTRPAVILMASRHRDGRLSWDVPAAEFGVDAAADLLEEQGVSTDGARIQLRSSESGEFVKIQVEAAEGDRAEELRALFAAAAGVAVDDVGVNLVSSSWGSDVTAKAIRALLVFLVLVAVFISIRFEWRMALAAIVAMLHDVVISVGIYSVFGFVVTPATVIAFLTILGYSLYDTIVVFDRVRENEARLAAHRAPFADVTNISMNQVIMRSVNTSVSSVVPVVSLLFIGAGLLGASTLSEFAVALLIGMVTGAYSSIFIAAPLLAVLKGSSPEWRDRRWARAEGEPLRSMVMGGLWWGLRPAGSSSPHRWHTACGRDSCRYARPASSPGPLPGRSTNSSTAPTNSRSTATRSTPRNGS